VQGNNVVGRLFSARVGKHHRRRKPVGGVDDKETAAVTEIWFGR
jgi:hypothetical protein